MILGIAIAQKTLESGFQLLAKIGSFDLTEDVLEKIFEAHSNNSSRTVELSESEEFYLSFLISSIISKAIIVITDNKEENINNVSILSDFADLINYRSLDAEQVQEKLSQLYNWLILSKFDSEEVQLLLYLQNPVKKEIIELLRNSRSLQKKRLFLILEQDFPNLDIHQYNHLIEELEREKYIKVEKNTNYELVEIINDIAVYLRPNVSIIKNLNKNGLPKQLIHNAMEEIKITLNNFDPFRLSFDQICELVLNLQIYKIILILKSTIIRKTQIDNFKTLDPEEVNFPLKILWQNGLIHSIRDETQEEYYILIRDICVEKQRSEIKRIYEDVIWDNVIKDLKKLDIKMDANKK